MDQRELNFMCNYVDMSQSSASQMLNICTQKPSIKPGLLCPTKSYQARRNTTYTDLSGIFRGYATSGQFSLLGVSGKPNKSPTSSTYEGFTTDNGPGQSTIPKNECPEGYTYDFKEDKCYQVCQQCVYRDNMKSREFNEADPCFPQGVYNGLNSDGSINCTCGSQDQYCSKNPLDGYTADGGLVLLSGFF